MATTIVVASQSIPEQQMNDGKVFPLVLTPVIATETTTATATATSTITDTSATTTTTTTAAFTTTTGTTTGTRTTGTTTIADTNGTSSDKNNNVWKDYYLSWFRGNQESINQQLTEHGAILFRGFPIDSPQCFLEMMQCFDNWEFGSYLGGGGPRLVVHGPIHTSTESPASHVIPYHHELAYLTTYPSKLLFWCEIPPKEKGETPILLSNRLYSKIAETNPSFIEKLKRKKVRYTRIIADRSVCANDYQRAWQDIFETEDRSEAERLAKQTGTDTVEWLEDGSMKVVSIPLNAIRVDPRTNKATWFNSIVLLHPAANGDINSPWEPTFEDGEKFDPADILSAKQIMEKEGVTFRWQKGDVLLIDNLLALHSRNSFTPPRRILAAILK